ADRVPAPRRRAGRMPGRPRSASAQGKGFRIMDMVSLTVALGLPPDRMAWCLAVVFAAGILRGYTGFGFAPAAVPTLALIVPPVMVVPLVLCLEIVASAQMLPGLWREVHFRSVGWLGLGSL